MTHDGLLIGAAIVGGPLHQLDDLGRQSGSDTGGKDVLGALIAGHKLLDGSLQSFLSLTDGSDLLAGHGVQAGQAVSGITESGGSICTQLGNSLINCLDSQSVHSVVTGENAIK